MKLVSKQFYSRFFLSQYFSGISNNQFFLKLFISGVIPKPYIVNDVMPTLDKKPETPETSTVPEPPTSPRAPMIYVVPPIPDPLPTASNKPASETPSTQNPTNSTTPTSTATNTEPEPDFDLTSTEGISLLVDTIKKLRTQKKEDDERIKKDNERIKNLQADSKKHIEDRNNLRQELFAEK